MGKMIRGGSLAAMVLAGAMALSGQQGSFQAPLSGYVFDGYAKAIRPVIGYVGSAYLGAPVARADWASISPDAKSAWLWSEGRLRYLPSLTTADSVEGPALDQPTGASWSIDGRRCLIASGALALLMSRNEAGELQPEREFRPEAGSTMRLLAASGDLALAAVAVRGGETGDWKLLLWQSGADPRELASMADPAAAVFDGAGILYVADAANKSVLRISLESEGGSEVVLTSEHGVDAPCALLRTHSGSLIVVERDARVVRRYALESRTLENEEALDETPEMLSPMGVNRFLLNQRTRRQQALLILDVSGDPKVSFVPAGE